jgi:predicted TIM-barrel fold metal-dependent hydrolase
MPAGSGVLLDDCHPRHLDYVAAKYPELTIVAGRPGWPWQDETNAVLLHKRNVWYELHGWSPKYFTPALKREISRRLRERVMFGADYPLFTYERLERDWREEGYSEDVLQHVFHKNAEEFFRSLEKR